MCRKMVVLVLLTASCLFLTACRVVFDPFAQNAEQKEVQKEHRQKAEVQEQEEVVEEEPEEPAFKIDATLTLDGENMVLSGETDLPADTILGIRLKPYKGNATVEEIKEETAGTLNEVPGNTVGIGTSVEEDGSLQKTYYRPDLSTRYRFELVFEPEEQEEEIKQQLIEQAGNLDELPGLQVTKEADPDASMVHGDDPVKGYIQTVNIMKADEKDGDEVTLEFE
jgi:PBP1b-binding outer membrane lipoprotein LpoB